MYEVILYDTEDGRWKMSCAGTTGFPGAKVIS